MSTNNAINSPDVGKNLLFNGDMQVWQRGAGGNGAAIAVAASTKKYTADRWQLSTGVNQACTVSQIAGTLSGSYVARVQRNSGQTGTGAILFCQPLPRDMCQGAAGNKVTFSFTAASGANFSASGGLLGVTVYSGTGTTDISGIAGTYTGSSAVINTTQAITSTLTRYSFTSTTLGSTVTQLSALVSFTPTGTAGANDWFSITDVQLEISDSATKFERRSFVQQLSDCQHFYWKTFDYGVAPAQNAGSNGAITYRVQVAGTTAGYRQTISIPPLFTSGNFYGTYTQTSYSPGKATNKWLNATLNLDSAAPSGFSQASNTLIVDNAQVAGDAVGNIMQVHITIECELV